MTTTYFKIKHTSVKPVIEVHLLWFNIFDDLGEIVVGSAKRAKNVNAIFEFARAAVAFLEFARAVVAFFKAFFLKKLK